MHTAPASQSRPSHTLSTLLVFLAALVFGPAAAQETVLFTFPAGGNSGYAPWYGSLNVSGSTLYGTVTGGGSSNLGVLFSVSTTGSDYTMLHEFAGGSTDGSTPYSSTLAISGSTVYGMTRLGGSSDLGVIYRMNTDGTGFSVLRSFDNTNDGRQPWGSVTLSGSTLYGMTFSGGFNSNGTLFRMDTDGSNFTVLRPFEITGGQNPRGNLLLSGTTLYGMTQGGGANNIYGTVFSVQTDGSNYTVLRSFDNDGNGYGPLGSLTLVGSTLYGMTNGGGANSAGAIFRLETDGSGFDLMHSFTGGPTEGAIPSGSLLHIGSQLFGLASNGNSGKGSFFTINLDGSGYTSLVLFDGTNGQTPYGDLVSDGTNIYGMTSAGGTWGNGVIFSYPAPIPEPGTYALLAGLLGLSVATVRRIVRRDRAA